MTFDELKARATIDRDGYRVFDGEYAQMSVTLEDAEWLYALVRVTKPKLVLELGTGLGVSGRFIAEALAENGSGDLQTIEPDAALRKRSGELLSTVDVWSWPSYLEVVAGPPDLVFIDSGYGRREADIREWTTGDYHGLVVVHDANRDYPGLRDAPGVFLPGLDGIWIGRAK